ncbi:interleukin-17B isoform X3 [Bubalus kerabau]|uniref:interleukin-17B isoform X3 n=1 Tax=Bubalus carabanensis TaxID=3119969 RepID=UPI00244EB72D|nr:interleukin-17B isoform X3 [Bubalus carabanensis]
MDLALVRAHRFRNMFTAGLNCAENMPRKATRGVDKALPGDQAKPYARMEEYERNLAEMVAQLRNSSEPARRKCEVNLQLWLSNKRSLSPWGYSINHDPSRIPADLPEAQCLCLGCVNPFTMQEDRSMVSVPVFSQVPVRRRLCPPPPRPGPCRQRAVMETIAVGCTCIF